MAKQSAARAVDTSTPSKSTRDVVETAVDLSRQPGTWESLRRKVAGRVARWDPRVSRRPAAAREDAD